MIDKRFQDIKFHGTFRAYQQRVIEHSAKHLNDKRLHIVAAPGSGKTILGLELIRMLGRPALILSPTVAIREQWKQRFEMFLPSGSKASDYVSCSLASPNLLTSITYQGLYSAYKKIGAKQIAEDDEDCSEQENYSSIDILQLIKQHNIGVLCLDEAHHLRAEWQRALHEFVQRVQGGMTIISLTATPPYDCKKSEWDKYIAMCGAIDEEIFVPELVRASTLCPHQDYVCYNFPTAEELGIIASYKSSVREALDDIISNGEFLSIITQSDFYLDPAEYFDELSDKPLFVKAVLGFLQKCGIEPKKQLMRTLEKDNRDFYWDLSVAEYLFQAMISDNVLFDKKQNEDVKKSLGKYGLVEKGRVRLITNEEVEKLLISSIGKLRSIEKIVDAEWQNLGSDIRLLILTDYIRVGSAVLGSDKEISEMGVVPIFELIRRKNTGLRLAAISGKIVIVPQCAVEQIESLASQSNLRIKWSAIKNTQHCELRLEGSDNAQKIALITRAFNAGIINAIIGTKSLLGEGWDSPVINTLILASFVGSFMLCNQMRGRAIRVDRNCPQKVSNIWHLTSILPHHLAAQLEEGAPPSYDYSTLERRFQGFMGVSYSHDVIESSLRRAHTLNAPYDEQSVQSANQRTFALAADRDGVRKRWQQALARSQDEVLIQNEIPKPKRGFIPAFIIRPSHYSTIKRVTHAVMKAFKQLSLINRAAKPVIEKDYVNKRVNVGVTKCTQYEKSIFHQAISEVLSPIDNPRYILVKRQRKNPDFRASFAVPESFATKKANAQVFMERMSRRLGKCELFYTRSTEGKKALALAKKRAYVNKADNEILAKMKLKQK